MECQSRVHITIPPAAMTREFLSSACSFLPNRLSVYISLLSSRPSTNASHNGTNGYYNGGGPAKDYFSSDPRFSHQSHLPSTLRPGSSRSTASPSVPHSPLYTQDDADPAYGWKDQTSSVNSARPPLPPKIPSHPAQIPHMPEPTLPTEDPYSPHPEPGGSNGAGASVYRNDSAGSYVLPPLPHPTYQPGQLVNPHTDSPSCKDFSFPFKKASLIFVRFVIQT